MLDNTRTSSLSTEIASEPVSIGPVVMGVVTGIGVSILSIGAIVVVTVILWRYLQRTKAKSKVLHSVANNYAITF